MYGSVAAGFDCHVFGDREIESVLRSFDGDVGEQLVDCGCSREIQHGGRDPEAERREQELGVGERSVPRWLGCASRRPRPCRVRRRP